VKRTLKALVFVLSAGMLVPRPVSAGEDDIVLLGAQDEYDVVQEKGLQIKELTTTGSGEDGGYGTPDIGVNGAVSLGKITVSGRFDLTLNKIDDTDLTIEKGTSIIAYDSLEKLVLQRN
jgi:hypothetical protein